MRGVAIVLQGMYDRIFRVVVQDVVLFCTGSIGLSGCEGFVLVRVCFSTVSYGVSSKGL